eukprot:TRINITY_DN2600_c0_g1_i1.p1 TRINITY_DN2600_c0_g1~~TRINITY_DN2600_c0_g1_i1.p1  ORF type:complete len:848 (+),score=221.36 TRINITY_DN2600_c0_g1_i1:24-2546(+)
MAEKDDEPAAAEADQPCPKDLQLLQSKGQAVTVYDAEAARRRQEEEERAKAEMDIIKAAVGTVFSTRKPRDAVAGTASGLKTMAKGVGIGLASLVVQPYVGAKSQGAKGFVKGVGTGVATCVGTTVAGTVVGSGQIMRGMVNTPGAIFRRALGEVWNSETRCWEKDWYSLPEEAAEVLGGSHASSSSLPGEGEAASSRGAAASSSGRRVTDTQLYDLLGVSPQASEAQIRKAFYKKSLALHPDKNPDDPAATEQFQAVSDAYRILGDEERRRAYDEHGKDSAAATLPKIEPVVFFAALFGTHHFEPYVGRLRLAQDIDGDLQSVIRDIVAIEDPEGPQLDALKVSRAHKRMKDLERERQVKCALALVKRLDPVVGIPSEQLEEAAAKWQAELESEVKKLAEAPLGVEMLALIGWLYVNGAEQFNSGKIQRMIAKAEAQVHMTKTKGSLAASAGRTCLTVNGIMKSVEKKKKLSESAAKEADDAPPSPTSPTSAAKGSNVISEDHEKDSSAQSSDKAKSSSAPPERHAPSSETAGKSSSSSSSTSPQAASELFPGTVVILCNLKSCAELNDEVGVVERFDHEAGRYVVQLLLEELGSRKLKAENLRVLEDPSETGSQWSTGGASSSSAPPGGNAGKPAEGAQDPGAFGAGNEEAELAEAFKDTMPLFHDTLWGVTSLDIEFTLARVVRRVLRDMSVDKTVRRQRAEALIRLGKILQEPMKARRKERRESKGKPAAAPSASAEEGKQALTSDAASNASEKTTSSRGSSMLARLKPRVPWSTKKKTKHDSEEQQQKAKIAEAKQKQMEAALALMAAGASTEDVDEMLAARSAMDFEFEPSSRT